MFPFFTSGVNETLLRYSPFMSDVEHTQALTGIDLKFCNLSLFSNLFNMKQYNFTHYLYSM